MDQIEKGTLEVHLYLILPNGQVIEERKTTNPSEEQEPLGRENKPGDKNQN